MNLIRAPRSASCQLMGTRMFDQGERAWPEEDSDSHTGMTFLPMRKREPWARQGGRPSIINEGRSVL